VQVHAATHIGLPTTGYSYKHVVAFLRTAVSSFSTSLLHYTRVVVLASEICQHSRSWAVFPRPKSMHLSNLLPLALGLFQMTMAAVVPATGSSGPCTNPPKRMEWYG
jgi:hypothetical protein